MSHKAIVFDLDGTLINTLSDIAAVVNKTREFYGYSTLEVEHIRGAIGKGIEALVKGCFPEAKPEQIEGILKKHRELYLKYPHVDGKVYDGVQETLRKLRTFKDLKVGIATNKPKPVAVLTLKHYLPDFTFDVVYGPEDVSKKKPDPAHLLETLKFLGVEPGNAIYCGDDPVDLKTANAASVFFLGAGWGFGGVKIDGPQQLERFEQILTWVERLVKGTLG